MIALLWLSLRALHEREEYGVYSHSKGGETIKVHEAFFVYLLPMQRMVTATRFV